MSFRLLMVAMLFVAGIIYSCSKGGGGGGGGTNPTNPCTGLVISVTGTVTNPSAGGTSDGAINASAGGSGFTFNINGGAFQSSGNFTNLAAGVYTIIAKNGNG